MESKPNPEYERIISLIDNTLEEYDAHTADHIRTEEEANWLDLCVMVDGGLITIEQAEDRHYSWLAGRGKSLI